MRQPALLSPLPGPSNHRWPPCPPCSNLIVLDEVMQHLDGEGCLRVAQLLKQASRQGAGWHAGMRGLCPPSWRLL